MGCPSLRQVTFLTRVWTHISCSARQILYHWATREALILRILLAKLREKTDNVEPGGVNSLEVQRRALKCQGPHPRSQRYNGRRPGREDRHESSQCPVTSEGHRAIDIKFYEAGKREQSEKREKRKGKGRRSACQRCRDPYLLSSASTSKKKMFDKCYTVWVLGLLEHATSPVAQMVKNLPAMQETWVRSLGWEDTLEKEMATYSKILALRIPWTEEPHGS